LFAILSAKAPRSISHEKQEDQVKKSSKQKNDKAKFDEGLLEAEK